MPNNDYIATIGIEVHAQLKTASKMFCGCAVSFGELPNVHTCPVCLGLPGSLPVVNKRAVILGYLAARALGCEIPRVAQFARKHYFYPDLPKGYQITMYQFPIGVNGRLEILDEYGELTEGVGIERVHLEEDSAKLFHHEGKGTFVDFNRAGVPLLEIVSLPEIKTASEAVRYLKELRRLLRFLGISDANMEEGSFRCEINVSVRRKDEEKGGGKVEIKNLNSFKAVQKSIEYEIERQAALLKRGEEVRSATVGWDEKEGKTVHQRDKEEAPEYRYFPEPDLPELIFEGDLVNESLFDMEMIPARVVHSLIERFGVSYSAADLLLSGTGSPPDDPYFVASFFEEAVERHRAQSTPAVNLIVGPVFEYLNQSGKTLDQTNLTPKKLAEITKMVERGELSSTNAKRAVLLALEEEGEVREVAAAHGLIQVSEDDELVRMVKEVVEENPQVVESIRRGKVQAIGALVGAVMKKSKGQADPRKVNEILTRMLMPKRE